MKITPDMVKRLREITGAGMMDCKRALEETGGDMEQAQELLREKGLAAAAKRASKLAAEGVVEAYIHMKGKLGVLIEVNCETDFVANTDEFRTARPRHRDAGRRLRPVVDLPGGRPGGGPRAGAKDLRGAGPRAGKPDNVHREDRRGEARGASTRSRFCSTRPSSRTRKGSRPSRIGSPRRAPRSARRSR